MEILPLDFVESKNTVRVASFLGGTLPLHCTAPGKVHLAFDLEEELRAGLPEKLTRYTEQTIIDRPVLLKEVDHVSGEGYAIENGEFIEDLKCVAVPVRDYTRSLVGCISVAGPAHRLTPQRIQQDIVPLIMQEGKALSHRLGFHD